MDLLAADSRRGAKTSACVGLAEIGSALPPIARALRHRSSTRVLMYACVHVPYGPSRPLPPALYSPRRRRTPTVLRQSPCKTDGPRYSDLPTIFPSNCLICIRSRFITVLPGNRTVSFDSIFSPCLPRPLLPYLSWPRYFHYRRPSTHAGP